MGIGAWLRFVLDSCRTLADWLLPDSLAHGGDEQMVAR